MKWRFWVWMVGLWLMPSLVLANGSYSHIHISELAVNALEIGALRDLMTDPAQGNAFRAGSMFPDSGYAGDNRYGEVAHWCPFLRRYLADIRQRYEGDYSSAEAKNEVAFLMGIASHGLADQTYDTTLLEREFEIDGPENPSQPVDQYADYFIVIDQNVRVMVEAWAPYTHLPTIFTDGVGHAVTADELMMGMNRMRGVINLQEFIADALYEDAWSSYPWLGTHVYNPDAIGSVTWTAHVVARYWEVLWKRLTETNNVDADLIIQTYPADGQTNWPVSASERGALGKIAVFFGYGVRRSQAGPLMRLQDTEGNDVPVRFATAYNGDDRNLIFVLPENQLAYDTEYTLEIGAGVETLDGDVTTTATMTSFRTRCSDERLSECAPLPAPLVTGPRPERPAPDAGSPPPPVMPAPDAGVSPDESQGGCSVFERPHRGDFGHPSWIFCLMTVAVFLWRRRTNATRHQG